MERANILLVGQDRVGLRSLRTQLVTLGVCISEASNEAAIQTALRSPPELVILACSRKEFGRDIELGKWVRATDSSVVIVVFATVSCEDLAIEAIGIGAKEFIRGATSWDLLLSAVRRYLPSGRKEDVNPEPHQPVMIGDSPVMRGVRNYLQKLAASDASVLITGDTGTGKELAAEMIHRHSRRAAKQMVCINCAAIPDTLLESELFGHARGAFTGAHSEHDGKLVYANGGTVFLDEIGDMSLSAQARILRAIESRRVERIGSNQATVLDIRVIAATNQPIDELIREGRFRQDLYFRLNVTTVHLPSLRERREDLPALLGHYLREFRVRLGGKLERFSPEALDALCAYQWPGNVRELRNLVESLFVTCEASVLNIDDLPEYFRKFCSQVPPSLETEKARILGALAACEWNKSKAAARLHWSRMTLYRKIKQHSIHSDDKDCAA